VLWAESATLGAGAADDLSVLVVVYRGDGLVCSPAAESVTLPAVPAALERVERWAARRIAALGAAADGASVFVLALHEVLANVVEHAHASSVTVRLTVTPSASGVACEAVLEDTGRPFVAPPLASPADGGRGLAICRAALAGFAYERDGAMNRWQLAATLPLESPQIAPDQEDPRMTGERAAPRGQVVIESLSGRVDMTTVDDEQARLRARLAGLPDLERLILRMADVEFIDSSGVGLLVVLQRDLQAAGARLVLAEVPAQARMALRLTRLEWLLPAFGSLEEALAAW